MYAKGNKRGIEMGKKDNRIVIRISTEDKIKMKMMALARDMTVSDFVLYCVMKQINQEQKKMAKKLKMDK